MSIEIIREFLGWCSVINIAVLVISTLGVALFQTPVIRVHQKLFNLDQQDLSRAYFQYLSHYKTATLILCVVPYLALLMMSR